MSSASRRWVKVWHEILTDPEFQNLSLEQQARYYNLLVYVSAHGDKGIIEIPLPARYLCHLFQSANNDDLIVHLNELLPLGIIVVCDNAKISVTISGWSKYQVDSTSYERQKRFREGKSVTPKDKDKEEDKEKDKEKDKTLVVPVAKNRGNGKQPSLSDAEFIDTLKASSAYKGINIDRELSRMDMWLLTPKGKGRKKTRRFIVNWLNKIDVSIAEGSCDDKFVFQD